MQSAVSKFPGMQRAGMQRARDAKINARVCKDAKGWDAKGSDAQGSVRMCMRPPCLGSSFIALQIAG